MPTAWETSRAQCGPIYRIEVPGRGSRVVVSGHVLVDELCDGTRFDEEVGPGLDALAANPASQELFTAETTDPDWRKARDVLLPASGPGAMRVYYPQMLDIAVQRWERPNPDDAVDVPVDMTRLTLDTIALRGFGYGFNSFHRRAAPRPHAWGEDAEAFDPDRFAPENRAKIPPNAHRPFGAGQRACIGRRFALQQATLMLGMLLQRFEFIDFAGYRLETKQTLTIKLSNVQIRAEPRARPQGPHAANGDRRA